MESPTRAMRTFKLVILPIPAYGVPNVAFFIWGVVCCQLFVEKVYHGWSLLSCGCCRPSSLILQLVFSCEALLGFKRLHRSFDVQLLIKVRLYTRVTTGWWQTGLQVCGGDVAIGSMSMVVLARQLEVATCCVVRGCMIVIPMCGSHSLWYYAGWCWWIPRSRRDQYFLGGGDLLAKFINFSVVSTVEWRLYKSSHCL